MGQMCEGAHPEGVQGGGKSRLWGGLAALGRAGGSLAQGRAAPGAQAVSSGLTETFLFVPEHQPWLHQGPAVPVLLLQRGGTGAAPTRGTVWGTGTSCAWGCSKPTPRGHLGVTAGSREGTELCTHQRTRGHQGQQSPRQLHPLLCPPSSPARSRWQWPPLHCIPAQNVTIRRQWEIYSCLLPLGSPRSDDI